MVTQDEFFCHEIAKRSVAGAAIHLGIEYMSEEVLDVLGDVLLSYLAKLGRTLSMAVESSGRTSAHVHVLDAIRAAEACTSPAVHQLHMMNPTTGAVTQGADGASKSGNGAATAAIAATGGSGTNGDGASASSFTRLGNTWQDLAVFCFGPDWQQQAIKELQKQKEEEEKQKQQQQQEEENQQKDKDPQQHQAPASQQQALPAQGGGGGGKNLLAHGMNGDSSTAEKEKEQKYGWDAPYRDEVPEFPLASPTCANPHRLSADVALSLHNFSDGDQDEDGSKSKAKKEEERVESELQGIPDDAFTTSAFSWGELDLSGQSDEESKKRDRDDVTNGSTSSNKRARVENAANNKETAAAAAKNTTSDEQEKENKGTDATKEASSTKKISFATDQQESKSAQQQQKRPAYIPHFYPPFPQTKTSLLGRTIIDAKLSHNTSRTQPSSFASHLGAGSKMSGGPSSSGDATSTPLGVRSSLVKLGQDGGYWGSEWDKNASTASETTGTLAVPFGRGRTAPPRPAVEPLTKASGSRVSRILEGSLDTAFN